MGNNVSRTGYEWQDTIHGQVKLADVFDVAKSDGQGAEVAFNTNGEEQGVTYSPGALTITLQEKKVTVPLVRWWLLRTLQLQGALIEQERGGGGEDGPRWVYQCAVSKVDEGNGADGQNTRTIELVVTKKPTLAKGGG